MAGRPNPRPSGGLESEVVACLAATGEAMTPGEVQAELGGDLAYTTVLTTLSRLHSKQVLTRSPRGRAYAYELIGGPTEAQAGLTARQMQKLLDAGVDRAGVLSRFVDSLDEDSEQILRELLSNHPVPPETARRKGRSSSRRRPGSG
jgi:predicted transcriptional regulator